MKTLCLIALISLAISTTLAESNLRKENQVRLTQVKISPDFPNGAKGFDFPIGGKGFDFPNGGKGFDFPIDAKGATAVGMEVHMDSVSMYYYLKNQYDRYEFDCVQPAPFAMYLKEQYRAYKDMTQGVIESMIMKYNKRADRCFYYGEFLDAYNGLNLGGN